MSIKPSSLGGGPYNGFSPDQFENNKKGGADVISRKILVKSWNGQYATGSYTGANGKVYSRVTTPFRAVNNLGDFLGRNYYSSGGPQPITRTHPDRFSKSVIRAVPNNPDGTGVPASSCNPRYVADCSDYIRYRKLRSVNRNYNDLKFGGDKSNASQVNIMAVRRF